MEDILEYDYIIIGAGTAGCVLTDALLQEEYPEEGERNQSDTKIKIDPHIFTRLVGNLSSKRKNEERSSKENFRILLLEYGPPRTQQQKPLSWVNPKSADGSKVEKESLIVSTDPHNWWKTAVSSIFSRQYFSEQNKECFNRNFLLARGSGAGGTSIVNAMQYSRGAPSDYLEWFDYESQDQPMELNNAIHLNADSRMAAKSLYFPSSEKVTTNITRKATDMRLSAVKDNGYSTVSHKQTFDVDKEEKKRTKNLLNDRESRDEKCLGNIKDLWSMDNITATFEKIEKKISTNTKEYGRLGACFRKACESAGFPLVDYDIACMRTENENQNEELKESCEKEFAKDYPSNKECSLKSLKRDEKWIHFNKYEYMNMFTTSTSQSKSERKTAFDIFVQPYLEQSDPRLTICYNTRVDKIIFKGREDNKNRVVAGVYATDTKNKTKKKFLLKKDSNYPCEVISCLGTYESPHLLLLSGIGDAIDIKNNFQIECELNNPNVGKHLKDHLLLGCIYSVPNRKIYDHQCENSNENIRGGNLLKKKICIDHALNGFHGWCNYKVPGGKGKIQLMTCDCSFLPTMITELILPRYNQNRFYTLIRNIFDFFISFIARLAIVRYFFTHFVGVVVCLTDPSSEGSIRLRSAEPTAPPLIHCNYFSHIHDLDAVSDGFETGVKIMESDSMKPYKGVQVVPGMLVTKVVGLKTFFRFFAQSYFHPTSTCRMGSHSDTSVVDLTGKVHGTENLRIVDASIIPRIPSSGTMGPVMMVAASIGSYIKEKRFQ